MGDTNMDKNDDLVDYNEVDLDGNPITTKATRVHLMTRNGLSTTNRQHSFEPNSVMKRTTSLLLQNHPVGRSRVSNIDSE